MLTDAQAEVVKRCLFPLTPHLNVHPEIPVAALRYDGSRGILEEGVMEHQEWKTAALSVQHTFSSRTVTEG